MAQKLKEARPTKQAGQVQGGARITRRAGVHAASPTGRGRSMCFGHLVPAGQLLENQSMARSKFAVARSRPEAMRSSVMPALKTIVETRERERPRAAQYASATVINWSRRFIMATDNAVILPHLSTGNLPLSPEMLARVKSRNG